MSGEPNRSIEMKGELRELTSRHESGLLMYPGQSAFTWIKPPFMPWMLVSIKPVEDCA